MEPLGFALLGMHRNLLSIHWLDPRKVFGKFVMDSGAEMYILYIDLVVI